MIIHSYICAFSTENLIAHSHIRVSIVTTYLKCQDIVKPMPPYSLFKISLCVWLAGWWASLATTRKMQQCVNVLTDMYYATVSLCMLLEMKLTTTDSVSFSFCRTMALSQQDGVGAFLKYQLHWNITQTLYSSVLSCLLSASHSISQYLQ